MCYFINYTIFVFTTLIMLCLNLRDEKKYGGVKVGKNGGAAKVGKKGKNGGVKFGKKGKNGGANVGKKGKNGGAAGVTEFEAEEESEDTP